MCWECGDSYRKWDPCKNSYVYETARDWHVKEVMRMALRPEVIEDLLEIVVVFVHLYVMRASATTRRRKCILAVRR